MARPSTRSRFVLRLPIFGVVDRKTLWHTGLLAALRTALRPRTKEPILLLFTERALARRYIKARSLAGAAAMPLEPAGLLREVLSELAALGIRRAAIDHPTAQGHAWRPVAIAKVIAAIDAKLPPFAEGYKP
jgi:hypothetical protein